MHSIKQIYLNMFFTLQLAYDGMAFKPQWLGNFLSESSPFTWANSMSADPAVWQTFKNEFVMKFNGETTLDSNSYDFVVDFLKNYEHQCWPNLSEVFVEANSKEQWENYFEDLSSYDEMLRTRN